MLCVQLFFFQKPFENTYMPSQKSHDNFLMGVVTVNHMNYRGSKWLQPLNVTRLHQKEPWYEARVWDQESTSPNRVGADMEVNSKFKWLLYPSTYLKKNYVVCFIVACFNLVWRRKQFRYALLSAWT